MSSRFDILDTPIPGLKRIQRKPLGDHQGYFERLFCAEELQALLPGRSIVQINHSLTAGAARCVACTFSIHPMPRPSS